MTQNAAGSVNATRLWTKDFVNCANVEGSSSLHRNNGRRRNDDTLYVIFNLHVRNFALKCIPFITIHASWGVMEGGSLPSPQTKPCTVFEIHSKSLILEDLNEMRLFGWIFNHMHKLFRGAGVYLFRIPSTLRSPFQNWGNKFIFDMFFLHFIVQKMIFSVPFDENKSFPSPTKVILDVIRSFRKSVGVKRSRCTVVIVKAECEEVWFKLKHTIQYNTMQIDRAG